MLFTRASLICIACLASAGAATPRFVPFDELAKHAQQYNNKLVSTIAYLQVDDEHKIVCLRPRPHSDMSGLPEIFVEWPANIPEKRAYAAAEHRVKLTGIFQYREFKVRTIRKATATEPGIEEHTQGFGWMGIFDKQLTKISEFAVIR